MQELMRSCTLCMLLLGGAACLDSEASDGGEVSTALEAEGDVGLLEEGTREASELAVAGCTAQRDWTFRYGAYSFCNSQSGTAHRVYMVCRTSPNNSVNTYVGTWVGPGQTSKVQCPQATVEVISFGSDFPD
jgi:hypothetical protein